ncbi:protein kinase domain-containing protein [Streptomyces sp. 796.1]|uniref:serine/threonine-protein kinase n=1 Tax=Streptomyces sp. 796.1 TaxID=3163029 RepID=UPI0039C922E8
MTHGGEGAMAGEPQPPVGHGAGAGGGRGLLAGRYRLGDHLGDGALGTVWQASDELVGREVAVKEPRLPAGLTAGERASTFELLRRTVRAAARIEHPAVITVHDVLSVDDRPWLVVELVRGGSLADTLRRATLGVRQAAHVGLAVAGALRAAHAAGLVHGDVKPSNVLFGRDRSTAAGRAGGAAGAGAGRVVLTDFGLVHAVDQQRRLALAGLDTGTGTGTAPAEGPAAGGAWPQGAVAALEFIAPERLAADAPAPQPPADLWALGVLLYAAVEGATPFRVAAPTQPVAVAVAQTVAALRTATPRPPAHAGPLTELIGRLLARDPAARPTAEQAEAALRELAAAPAAEEPPCTPRAPGPANAPGPSHAPGPANAPHAAHAPGPANPPQAAHDAPSGGRPTAGGQPPAGGRRAGRPSSMETLQLRALRRGDPEPPPSSDTTQQLTAIGGTRRPAPDGTRPPATGTPAAPTTPTTRSTPQGTTHGATAGAGRAAGAYGRGDGPQPYAAQRPDTGSAADGERAGGGLPGALPAARPMAGQTQQGDGFPRAGAGVASTTAGGAAGGGAGARRGPWGSIRPRVALGALGALVVVVGAGAYLLTGPLKDDEAAPPPQASTAPPTSGAPATSAAPTPTGAPTGAPRPALPAGWRLTAHAPLTAQVALPEGFRTGGTSRTEASWTGGDQRAFTIGLTRDTALGDTAAEASEQQISWYRDTQDSSMEDVRTRRHTLDWYGQPARWIEVDYRIRGKREQRRRLELFVPGAEHRVYQLRVDTTATAPHRTEQERMFAVARDQLRIDTDADAGAGADTDAGATDQPPAPTDGTAPTDATTPDEPKKPTGPAGSTKPTAPDEPASDATTKPSA